jgi:hypothetical protein
MNRREFSKKIGMAGVLAHEALSDATGNSVAPAQSANRPETNARSSGAEGEFPQGNYTPFGYLDNPYHTWDVHPSGVIRSVPALGMGWYYPAGPGGYFYYKADSIYRAMLRFGFQIGGTNLFESGDFHDAGIELSSPHHSKDLLSFAFEASGVAVSAAFFLIAENTIACRMSLQNTGSAAQDVRITAIERLELGEAQWWGRDGISGNFDEAGRYSTLRSFAAGPVFILKSDRQPLNHLISPDDSELKEWMAGSRTDRASATTYFPQPLNAALKFHVSLSSTAVWTGSFILSRSDNYRFAARESAQSLLAVAPTHAEKVAADGEYWGTAPVLDGDFPDHWKHSWVYDFETLRMMVRRPIGLYQHPWDAMQIQAPRNVLAETSIDMWALAYANPEAAKAVLLGQFQDAVEPNVPCSREDGVMNMVAADGSECGTAIQWCYPFYCIESVFLRTGDEAWLAKIYPYLSLFVEWTLKHRTDSEGWIVAKCSWESGMDASSRFLIQQPTGGELIDFIRVAEIQAAMAHAARTLQNYAAILGHANDVPRWKELVERYTKKTRELFYQSWFYDVDSRTGKPIVVSGHREVTQVAPIMCGVATPEQSRAMIPAMLEYNPEQEYWLEWASLVLPYAESMWKSGQREPLSNVLHELIDRVYASMDRRDIEPAKKIGWPGVSCEYWSKNGAAGGEGYGWGATLPAHVVRSIFGFRELAWGEDEQFELGPNLPASLLADGKNFGLRNVHFRKHRFDLWYGVASGTNLEASLRFADPSVKIRVLDDSGQEIPVKSSSGATAFSANNHALYRVKILRG